MPIILANRRASGFKNPLRRRLLTLFARKLKAGLHVLSPKRLMSRKYDARDVIIAGGDGSFDSALNNPSFKNARLGFFPLGAGNALYHHFYKGYWLSDLQKTVRLKESKMDVLEVKWEGGSRQTVFLSLGFDAEVMQHTKKKEHGLVGYVRGMYRAARQKLHAPVIEGRVDGKKVTWRSCVNVSIGKIPYFGYGLKAIPGKVDEADGFVYGYVCHNWAHKVLHFPARLLAGTLALVGQKGPFDKIKARRLKLSSKVPLAVQAGGEFLGYSTWVDVKVKRQQSVLVGHK